MQGSNARLEQLLEKLPEDQRATFRAKFARTVQRAAPHVRRLSAALATAKAEVVR